MILGIDVGGTHTDAVLVDHQGVRAAAKVETRHLDLLSSIQEAMEAVLDSQGKVQFQHFNLSTTLCTNAIVQDTLPEVGVLISAGPGIDPKLYSVGDYYNLIKGGLDHRGKEIEGLDLEQAQTVINSYFQQGLKVFSVVGKFSCRNPIHEHKLANLFNSKCDFLTQGHMLSGQLNFPRRIATAYYNSAVWPMFNDFASSIIDCLEQRGLTPRCNILKANGGTMPIEQARQIPVESIFSGPAASIMGIMALCQFNEDAILLDVGGTTTDVAVFADGVPLIETESIDLDHRPTLVRAMKTKSVGLGGDSVVRVENGEIRVGPNRLGPCLAQGGDKPTLMDALNCLEGVQFKDFEASHRGIGDLAAQLQISEKEVATSIVELACQKIKQETEIILKHINERPVYTVHEVLEYKKVCPKNIYLMGGPAQILAPYFRQCFNLPVIVPEHFDIANALGSALARPTFQIELFADTEKRSLSIPELQIYTDIPKELTLNQAEEKSKELLRDYLSKSYSFDISDQEAEIIEHSSMNMVKNMRTVGQDIRVKCQVKPDLLPEFVQGVRCLCKEL